MSTWLVAALQVATLTWLSWVCLGAGTWDAPFRSHGSQFPSRWLIVRQSITLTGRARWEHLLSICSPIFLWSLRSRGQHARTWRQQRYFDEAQARRIWRICVTWESKVFFLVRRFWKHGQSIDVFISCVLDALAKIYCVFWTPIYSCLAGRKILLDKPDFEIKNVILTARVPILNLGTWLALGFSCAERSLGKWWLSGSWIMEVVMLTFQWTTRRPHWSLRLNEPRRCKIKISPALELQLISSHTQNSIAEFCWEGIEKLSFAPCLCTTGSSYCWEPRMQADCWEF